MATTIVTKSGSGAPAASDLVAGELAVDLTNGRLYTEDSGGTVLELGLNPNGNVNVTGSVTADGTASSSVPKYTFAGDVNTGLAYIGADAVGLLAAGSRKFYVNATTGYFQNLSGGVNFGSGIDVTGSVTADGLTSSSTVKVDHTGDLTAAIQIGDPATLTSDTGVYFRTSGTAHLTIPASGSLLIDGTSSQQFAKFSGNGDISFYEDTGTTAKLFWDASAESLGIGTSSPATTLDVSGAVTAGGLTVDVSSGGATATAATLKNNGSGANTKARLDFFAASTRYAGISGGYGASAPEMSFDINGTDVLDITATGIDVTGSVTASGDVLVGRTAVTYAGVDLHVGSTSDAQNGIQIQTSPTGYGYVLFGDGSGADAYRGNLFYKHGDDYMAMQTAGAERMRIDASGNLLLGKTSSANAQTTVGHLLLPDGRHYATASGGPSGIFSRTTSDGDILSFYQGSTPTNVGSIGTNSNTIYIDGSAANTGLQFAGSTIAPRDAGALSDASVDLGNGSYRFKDLYLSGRVLTGDGITDTGSSGSETVFNSGQTTANFRVAGVASANTLFIDGGTNNVGIGTSSPSASIDVVSLGTNSQSIAEFSSASGKRAEISTDAQDDAFMYLYDSADAIKVAFRTDGNASYFNGGGNVGIGTTSPVYPLVVSNGGAEGLEFIVGSTNFIQSYNRTAGDYTPLKIEAETIAFATDNGAERMRIDASGNVLVGTTTFSSAGGGHLFAPSGTRSSSRTVTTAAYHNLFYNANGIVGGISTNGSATTYATSSDQRLKESIADADDAGSKIDAIQVRKFDWKADGSHQDYGMVAQELLEVAPEAVSQGETEDDMMGVDYSKLVPMMLKEIQSLRARIAQLES